MAQGTNEITTVTMDLTPQSTRLSISRTTEVAFRQLDPILKSLLDLVTDYRKLTESWNEEVLEKWYSNIQLQLEQLDHLSTSIQSLGPHCAPGLLILAEYISLPLTAIFHVSEVPTNDSKVEPVAINYLRKLQQSSADCIRIYVEAVSSPCHEKSNGPTMQLSTKHAKQYLVALTKGIPRTIVTQNNMALDDGSTCWRSILMTIKQVLNLCSLQYQEDSSDRGLIVRLVDCGTALLVHSKDVTRLESLHVLSTLMEQVSNDPTLWKSIFPGTLAELYRCLLSCRRQASTGESVAVECAVLRCIGTLLTVTLKGIQGENASTSPATTSTESALLEKINLLAQKSKASSSPTTTTSTTSSSDFLSQLQEKAVTPLILILKQSISSTASSVQLYLIQLCRIFLLETAPCWSGTSIPLVAMECCLILQHKSGEDHVIQAAETVLHAYRQHMGSKDAGSILSKVHAMVEELPILSQGGKRLEVKMHLQLLKGYVQSLDAKDIVATSFTFSPWIQLMDVDISATTQVSRPLPILEVSCSTNTCPENVSKLPIMNLSLENVTLAGEVLEAFGKVLGPKQGAYAVDSILSDVFDKWTQEQPTLTQLKEWASSIVVATKVLIGAFQSRIGETQSKKAEQRRRRILLSISTSILPLVIDPPIQSWTISVGSGNNLCEVPYPTPQLMQAIDSISILSLEFLSQAAVLLVNDVETLVPTILYPILEKVHIYNNRIVQEAARDAIRSIVFACESPSISEFLQSEAMLIFAEIFSRLRIPGRDEADTWAIVATLTWVLDEMSNADFPLDSQQIDYSAISSLIELCDVLMNRLDHYFLDKKIGETSTYILTKLYSAIFRYFMFVFEVHGDAYEGHTMKDATDGSWLSLLSVFETPAKGFEERLSSQECDGTTENGDGTKTRRKMKKAEVDLCSKIISRACYLLSNESLRVQISVCESISFGFQFLGNTCKASQVEEDAGIQNAIFQQVAMSWPSITARLSNVTNDIMVTNQSITMFVMGPQQTTPYQNSSRTKDVGAQFFFLSGLWHLVADMFESSGDFMADRIVSSAWPTMAKQFAHMMRYQQTQFSSNPTGSQCISTPGSRGQNLAPALRHQHDDAHIRPWNDAQRHLLISMIRCLERIFRCPEAHGTSLQRIHQAVGLVLLPFMGDPDDEIELAAEEAIRSIVAIDGDVLLRPLLEMTGRGIPPCPVRIPLVDNNAMSTKHMMISTTQHEHTSTISKSNLARRCENILQFIAMLPEQELH